jgi:hypothetical protein
MKYITTIINKLLTKELPKPVGRWRIENCNSVLNHKIDLSNEDHCGPCGQYALEKKIELTNNEKKKNTDIILENLNNKNLKL